MTWETEKDLIELAGMKGTKHALKSFRNRLMGGPDLFEDLRLGEYFPPQYLCVDRIIAIEDRDLSLSILEVDWENAVIPEIDVEEEEETEEVLEDKDGEEEKEVGLMDTTEQSEKSEDVEDLPQAGTKDVDVDVDVDAEEEDADAECGPGAEAQPSDANPCTEDEVDAPAEANKGGEGGGQEKDPQGEEDEEDVGTEKVGGARRSKRTPRKTSTPSPEAATPRVTRRPKKRNVLHTKDAWVTVKWEGLTYAQSSVERVADLRRCGMDYEHALRQFYR